MMRKMMRMLGQLVLAAAAGIALGFILVSILNAL